MAKMTRLTLATLLLAGVMAIGACTGSEQQNSDSDNAELKEEISLTPEEKLQLAIKECDKALAELKQVIDAKESGSEERFQARRAFKSISEHRERYQKRLDSIRQYFNPDNLQLKKEILQMSVAQLEDAINGCDTVLAQLKQVLDSKGSNPEERFRALRAFNSISEQRELYQKRLDKIRQK